MAKLDDSAFLATVVHELRAPLNACLMSLNLLELKAAQKGEVLRCAEVIKRNLERQARLIDDLADIAQLASEGVEVVAEPVQAGELLDAAVASARSAAAERGVGINPVESTGGSRYPIKADRDRLTRAVSTLIEYLVAGAPPGSRIALQLAASNAGLALHGSRSDPEDLANLDDAPTSMPKPTEPKGFVVRLAIVEQVLEAHGGSLDRGAARFTLTLPLHSE